MQIRTQAYLDTFLSAAAIAAVAVTLFVIESRAHEAIARSDFANSIVADGIGGLRVATLEYSLYRQPGAGEQWRLSHRSLASLLENDILKASPEEAILDGIRAGNARVGELFAKLEATPGRREGQGEASDASRAQEARLLSDLMLATQDMVMYANRLSHRSHEQLFESHESAGALVLALVALLGLLVLVRVLVLQRLFLRPIRELVEGAQAIGAGDLAFRIRAGRKNEVGILSDAFNGMAASLARARADVESRNVQLEHANADLESFSYSVSHDLRAPLRGIDGWSAALLEDFGEGLDPRAREYLALVRAETLHMEQLIDELLKLSRVGRAEMRVEVVDLTALARRSAARLSEALPGRRIEFDVQDGLAAQGDPRLLEILFTNLLDNACKFTAPRSIARIAVGESVGNDPDSGRRSRTFFVRDNGVGFDVAYAQKLFGAFQRLHRQSEFPGTGIGLATVKRIVTRHGGRIWAEARVDEGAAFYFSLGSPA